MAYDKSDKSGSNQPDRNPDPITGAPGSHPLGTGVGSASGAATGAAIGAVGGPVGAMIGGVAGAVVGAFTGHKVGEAHDPTEDWSRTGRNDPHWRENYEKTPYHSKKVDFDHVAPAYDVGARTAHQHVTSLGSNTGTTGSTASTGAAGSATPRMRPFSEVEHDVRSRWDSDRGNSKLSYDEARPAIQDAYDRTLRLHEERLRVNKDRVQTGEVRMHKEIISEQQTINVPVEREEIVIETRAVNDAAGDRNATIGEGETIRVPVSEERVHVEKDVVTTGEVHLNKRKIQETEKVVDTIRKEKVKVDQDPGVRVNDKTNTNR